jgi:hypothetical protein
MNGKAAWGTALLACLLITTGGILAPAAQATVLYGLVQTSWAGDFRQPDQLVRFDTSNPGEVEAIANLNGIPEEADYCFGRLAWDPASPGNVYALRHQSGFGPFWLLEIDIATGTITPTFVLQGYGMSGLAYVDHAPYAGLLA